MCLLVIVYWLLVCLVNWLSMMLCCWWYVWWVVCRCFVKLLWLMKWVSVSWGVMLIECVVVC